MNVARYGRPILTTSQKRFFSQTNTLNAGGGTGRSVMEYPYDESKYQGFWKYYNTETPIGRAYVSKINLGACALLGFAFYLYKKMKKSDTKK